MRYIYRRYIYRRYIYRRYIYIYIGEESKVSQLNEKYTTT